MTNSENSTEWLNAFLPIGCMRNGSWEPRGAGVLILDRPIVWLVTSRQLVEGLGDEALSTWIPGEGGTGLLNLTDSLRNAGLDWLHHPAGLSATMMPLDESFRIKAFAETQCTRVRELQPLQPAASLGCLYGNDIEPQPQPTAAVFDGIISSANQQTGTIYTTAPMLPRNLGAPLLLASPYGGSVTLAGILLGNAMFGESDPRVLPVRLGRAICVDAALELIRGEQANQLRQRVASAGQQPPPPAPPNSEESAG